MVFCLFIWEQIAGETGELLPERNAKPYPHKRFAEISTLGSCSNFSITYISFARIELESLVQKLISHHPTTAWLSRICLLKRITCLASLC